MKFKDWAGESRTFAVGSYGFLWRPYEESSDATLLYPIFKSGIGFYH